MMTPHVTHLENKFLAGSQVLQLAEGLDVESWRLFQMKMLAGLEHQEPVTSMIANGGFNGNDVDRGVAEQLLERNQAHAHFRVLLFQFGIFFPHANNLKLGRLQSQLDLA